MSEDYDNFVLTHNPRLILKGGNLSRDCEFTFKVGGNAIPVESVHVETSWKVFVTFKAGSIDQFGGKNVLATVSEDGVKSTPTVVGKVKGVPTSKTKPR